MKSFSCPKCWRVSYHPEDVRNGYCGHCHEYTGQFALMGCVRCDSTGRLADTPDRESWQAWLAMPPESLLAVFFGMVKPILCDACRGLGFTALKHVPRAHE